MKETASAKVLNPRQIEKELTTLWIETGERISGTPGSTATRICTLNLIVYIEDKSRLDAILSATSAAADMHPMRAIPVIVEPEKEESGTEGQISGYCRIAAPGSLQICCEQIVLTVTGDAVDELPGTLTNILIPNLPVVLWWTGSPPSENRVFERLASIADFLIVDSREFRDAAQDMANLAAIVEKYKQMGVADLNWVRLTPWRIEVAAVFDDPTYQSCLPYVDTLSIEYSNADGNPAQAALLAGWFISRMSWRPSGNVRREDGAFTTIASRGPSGDVQIRLSPAETSADKGDISSITIEAGEGKTKIHLSRTKEGDSPQLTLTAQAENTPPLHRTVPLGIPTLGNLIANTVEAMSPDPTYETALYTSHKLLFPK